MTAGAQPDEGTALRSQTQPLPVGAVPPPPASVIPQNPLPELTAAAQAPRQATLESAPLQQQQQQQQMLGGTGSELLVPATRQCADEVPVSFEAPTGQPASPQVLVNTGSSPEVGTADWAHLLERYESPGGPLHMQYPRTSVSALLPSFLPPMHGCNATAATGTPPGVVAHLPHSTTAGGLLFQGSAGARQPPRAPLATGQDPVESQGPDVDPALLPEAVQHTPFVPEPAAAKPRPPGPPNKAWSATEAAPPEAGDKAGSVSAPLLGTSNHNPSPYTVAQVHVVANTPDVGAEVDTGAPPTWPGGFSPTLEDVDGLFASGGLASLLNSASLSLTPHRGARLSYGGFGSAGGSGTGAAASGGDVAAMCSEAQHAAPCPPGMQPQLWFGGKSCMVSLPSPGSPGGHDSDGGRGRAPQPLFPSPAEQQPAAAAAEPRRRGRPPRQTEATQEAGKASAAQKKRGLPEVPGRKGVSKGGRGGRRKAAARKGKDTPVATLSQEAVVEAVQALRGKSRGKRDDPEWRPGM